MRCIGAADGPHFVECNRVVNFEGDARLVGQMIDLRITRSLAYTLRGEVVTVESTQAVGRPAPALLVA